MVDEDHERADVVGDPADDAAEVRGLLGGKPGCGLVEQHDARLADDRARDLDEPAFGGAERVDPIADPAAETDELDGVDHVGDTSGAPAAAAAGRA